ncbi:MAG: type II secretion system protein GspF [Acidobacteria bacterium]|nr:MAG: type II secretion system protein GspF [Acidobacteriota bacterium]
MATFFYRATNSHGKVETGQLEMESKQKALEKLEKMGLFPILVSDKNQQRKEISLKGIDLAAFLPSNRISGAHVLDFTDKLATLLKAGLPLAKALRLLIDTTQHAPMKDVIQRVLKDVSAGQSFAESLAKHPRVFGRLYINMVKTGETAGVLEKILFSLRDYQESRQNLKSFLVSALIYPSILLLVGLGTVLVLVLFVLPRFQEVFDQVGQELPFITRSLVDITNFLSTYKWLLSALVLIIWVWFSRWKSTPEGRYKWDRFKLRAPVLKTIITEVEVTKFSNALGILLTSSVSLLEAMSIVRELFDNSVFIKAMEPAIKAVKRGDGMSVALSQAKVFPKMVVHLITVGEETGTLGEMFQKVAGIYQQNIERNIKRLLAMFEPVMIIVMFVVVGFIVAAMLLAVTSLSQAAI